MRRDIQEYKEIKDYLLGIADSEESREHVEKRLLTDTDYYENMLSIEEELTQYYVDGNLSPVEKSAFETYFLNSRERQANLNFADAFREHLDSLPSVKLQPEESVWARFFSFKWMRMPVLASAATAILVLFSSFFAWNWYVNYSSSQGVALLNKAYEHERPLESRITELNYAPYFLLRSGADPQVDKLELSRAKQQIEDAAAQNPSVANLISLARLYLTEKNFDEAAQQLEKARQKDPKNAEIHNDLGVSYLEKAETLEDKDAQFKLRAQAYENFDKALEYKPNMREALFNKARSLQALPFKSRAKEAWREYLKHDYTSPWADEARKRLQDLEEETSEDMSADEFQQAFLNTVNSGNSDEAFKLASLNRDMIEGRFLPQRLAMSLADADDEGRKSELYRGLKYLGELEKERNQDNFTADLAAFYDNLSPEKRDVIRNAQSLMRDGYKLCIADEYAPASEKFSAARELFLNAGDVVEARTMATYFMAYSLYYTVDRPKGVELFKEIDEFSRQKNYRWFALMNLDWLIAGRSSHGLLLSTDVDNRFQAALKQAEDMGDLFMTQKFLRSINARNLSVRQEKNTYANLQRILEYSGMSNVSSRQKDRGFDSAIETLSTNGFKALSRAIALESLESSKKKGDRSFVIQAQKNAGKIYAHTDDFSEAELWLNQAKATAQTLTEPKQKSRELAEITSALGDMEYEQKNFPASIQYYDESLEIQKNNDTPLLYETRKSRLLAYEKQKDDAAIEKELPEIISLAEEKRKQITNEEERNSFFGYEQKIYDVAIQHEFRAQNAEEAFDYAESSNSRSLLDQLQKDIKANASGGEPDSLYSPAEPLKTNEIRNQIPSNVQLLQYAVLEDRVLIWVISNEKFELVSSPVKEADLNDKIMLYVKQTISHDRSQQDQARGLAQEFYNLLITPVLGHLDRNREICIIPNKALFKLPFAALISPSGNYLIQEFGLFSSPSANVFVLLTQEAQRRTGTGNEQLLSIGDPAFDRQQLPRLLPLPDSAKEAKSITAGYTAPKVLLGANATEKAFRQSMGNADVIHFAGHYVIHPKAPLLSELVMAKSSNAEDDGFFTNAELRGQKLSRTKLVVLSACQTGVEGYYNGEGLVGLSRTFLALSVPVVVASQWSVDSGPTAELMKKFHQYRKQEKLSTAKALRRAQLEMLNAADERFRTPYYWAPFTVFGGYAEF